VTDQYEVHDRLTPISDREMAELVQKYSREYAAAEKIGIWFTHTTRSSRRPMPISREDILAYHLAARSGCA